MLDTAAVLTFLIADLRGYTPFTEEHGDEAAARLAARFAEIADEAVSEHGGEVVELRGDEVLAVFRSARQALRSAASLQSRWSQETSQQDPRIPGIGIGLDAGEAVPVRDGYRGAALNLAARLCGIAQPGEILASDSVTHLAHRVSGLIYIDRGPRSLKGIGDAVRVMAVCPEEMPGERAATVTAPAAREVDIQRLPTGGYLGALPAGPLIGRERDMEPLRRAIAASLAGEGTFTLLSGEPGAGKTRLAQEVTRLLLARGFLIAAGRCYEEEQVVPYYPIREALATLHAHCSPALRTEIGRRWPEVLRLLPQDGVRNSPLGQLYGDEGPEQQQRFFWSVSSLIAAAALERPLALLFDDLQWADASTLRLLQHIARHRGTSPIFLLGTYRDVEVGRHHPLERALRDLGREELATRIEVRRLNRQATGELFAVAMGGIEIPAPFMDFLYTRTDGNAFFVQQVARALIEQGVLAPDNGGWRTARLEELEVPESIRSVIGQRLSRLPDVAQQVLGEASVLGQVFSFTLLAGTSERTEGELETALEQATASGLLREQSGDRYAFDHALTRQTLYSELTARKRRRLHLRAGAGLERLPDRRRDAHAAELAWHFLQGDDPKRALPYTLLAADQANLVYARSEAEQQYRTTFELASDIGDRRQEAVASEKLGQLLFEIGQAVDAIPVLQRAGTIFRELGDREAEGRALAVLALAHFHAGSADAGIILVQQAIDERAADAPSPALAALHDALATLLHVTGARDRMRAAVERGREIARVCGDPAMVLRLEVRRAAILSSLGLLREARESLEPLIPAVEQSGDLLALTRAISTLTSMLCEQGDVVAAEPYARRLLEIGRTSGHAQSILLGFAALGQIDFFLGRWDQAQAHFEEAAAVYERTAIPVYREMQLGILVLRMFRGDEQAYRDIEAQADQRPHVLQGMSKLLADVDLVLGRPVAAIARLEPFLDDPDIRARHMARVTSARARLRSSPNESTVATAEEIARAASNDPIVQDAMLWRFEPLLLLAEVLAIQNRWPEAEETFEQALAVTSEPRFPYWQATVQREYGRHAARVGQREKAIQLLREALETFLRLGAGFDVRVAEQALRSIETAGVTDS